MDVYETMSEIYYDLIRQDLKHHNITVIEKREKRRLIDFRIDRRAPLDPLTTTKFHIFAASATVVHTVLQPASSINFWGLLYKRSYMTLAPRPGSH
jgi:hypothetical protein